MHEQGQRGQISSSDRVDMVADENTHASTHLVERCHSLSELGFDLRQRLGPLQGLLQLLYGVVQPFLKLPVFLLALHRDRMTAGNSERTSPRAAGMIKATDGGKCLKGALCMPEWKQVQAANQNMDPWADEEAFPTCLWRDSLLANSFSSLSLMSWRDVASLWALRYLQHGVKWQTDESESAKSCRKSLWSKKHQPAL